MEGFEQLEDSKLIPDCSSLEAHHNVMMELYHRMFTFEDS